MFEIDVIADTDLTKHHNLGLRRIDQIVTRR